MDKLSHLWLRSIEIKNYKSIANARVDLDQNLNFIIGENGGGKSSLLQFIDKFVDFSAYYDLNSNSYGNTDYALDFAGSSPYCSSASVHIQYSNRAAVSVSDGITYSRQIKITEKKQNEIADESVFNLDMDFRDRHLMYRYGDQLLSSVCFLRDFHRKYVVYNLPEASLLSMVAIPGRIVVNASRCVSIDGETRFSFLQQFEKSLLLRDFITSVRFAPSAESKIRRDFLNCFLKFSRKLQMDKTLKSFTNISGIRLSPNLNIYMDEHNIIIENIVLEFQMGARWMPWSYLSDGTKRLFYLISETLCLDMGLLMIEEPELGLYPRQLLSIMEFVKLQSLKKQIIIITHSPILINSLSCEDLSRIFIAKRNKTGYNFVKLSSSKRKKNPHVPHDNQSVLENTLLKNFASFPTDS